MRRYHKQYNYAQFFVPRRKRNWGSVIGGAVSAIAGSQASSAASKASKNAAKTAAGYQPAYSSKIDKMLYGLMQQQAGMPNQMGQYQPAANAMLGQYYNMIGQPYQTAGTYAPDTTTQTLNPAYTEWQNLQSQPYTGNGWDRKPGGVSMFNRTPAPEQYLSTTTPGAYTPGATVNPTGVNYSDLLNKYLTGAFDNNQNDVYQNLLGNTQQGARSAATARGLNTSPYGAGMENEAVRQMNLSWAADEQNRQQSALQNYLSGQTGMAGLGQNALSVATQLEGLKKGWNQTDISNMLNYIGKAQGNLGQAGAIQAAAGQQAASPWNQLANTAGQYAANYNWGGNSNYSSPAYQSPTMNYTANWNPSSLYSSPSLK